MALPVRRDITIVCLAGALGGILVSAPAFVEPATYAAFHMASWMKLVVLPIVFGILASGIGVFVLTDPNFENKAKLFFFAAICGLSSQAIIESGKSFVTGEARKAGATVAAKEQAQQVAALAASDNVDAGKLADKTIALMQTSSSADNETTKAVVQPAIDSAIRKLPEGETPESSIQALEKVGMAATGAKDFESAWKVLNAVEFVKKRVSDDALAVAKAEEVMRRLSRDVQRISPTPPAAVVTGPSKDAAKSAPSKVAPK